MILWELAGRDPLLPAVAAADDFERCMIGLNCWRNKSLLDLIFFVDVFTWTVVIALLFETR